MHTLLPVAKYARAFCSNSSFLTGRGKDTAAVSAIVIAMAVERVRAQGTDAGRMQKADTRTVHSTAQHVTRSHDERAIEPVPLSVLTRTACHH